MHHIFSNLLTVV